MPNGISVSISFGLTRLDENPILEELYVLSTLAADDGPGSTSTNSTQLDAEESEDLQTYQEGTYQYYSFTRIGAEYLSRASWFSRPTTGRRRATGKRTSASGYYCWTIGPKLH